MAVSASPRAARSAFWRLDDSDLGELIEEGDDAAFEELYERHHRGLLSLSGHLLGSREEAEDAVQHTFGAAYRELTAGRAPRHLKAWLYATARNRCLDVIRGRRELPAEHLADRIPALPEEVEQRDDLRTLLGDIARLPEEQRTALVLSQLGDLEHREVAEVIGCERGKVRALVFQARSSLSGWREARDQPCRDVREHLAVARGGALRRGSLRRHLEVCEGCASFRDDVLEQRRRVALVLPVVPTLALKGSVLDSALGAAGGAAAPGGGVAGGAGAGAAGGAPAGGGSAGAGAVGGVASQAGVAGGGAAGAATSGAVGAALGAGSLGAAAVKIGATALVLGGAGLAGLGGLPGGGSSTPEPGPTPPASAAATERRQADGDGGKPAGQIRPGAGEPQTGDGRGESRDQPAAATDPSAAPVTGGSDDAPPSGGPTQSPGPEAPASPPPGPRDGPGAPNAPQAPDVPLAPEAPRVPKAPRAPDPPDSPRAPAPPAIPPLPDPPPKSKPKPKPKPKLPVPDIPPVPVPDIDPRQGGDDEGEDDDDDDD